MKKAHGVPPWTRRKLFRFREKQRIEREELLKEENIAQRNIERSARKIDVALKGCVDR